jgi:hypothetical protein
VRRQMTTVAMEAKHITRERILHRQAVKPLAHVSGTSQTVGMKWGIALGVAAPSGFGQSGGESGGPRVSFTPSPRQLGVGAGPASVALCAGRRLGALRGDPTVVRCRGRA